MNRLVPKSLSITIVGVATLVQIALAGMAWWSRRAVEEERDTERTMTANYATQLAAAERREAEGPQGRVPRAVLLTSADVAGTLRALQTIGDDAGVTVLSSKASQSTTIGRQSFVITGRGTPEQLCAFLAGIEQSERLMVIEGGKVTPGTETEINFEMGLSTHHTGGTK